jgi:predicted RND superfamily exporter protein
MLSYMSPPKMREERPSLLDKFLSGIVHPCAVGRGRWVTVAVVVAICIFCSFYATKVYFGDVHEGSSILWPDSRYNRDAKLLAGPFTGLQNPMLVVLEAKEKAYSEKMIPPGEMGEWHKTITEKAHVHFKAKPDLKRVICYPEVLKMAEAFQRRMFALPEVGATESFVDLLKKVNMLFYLENPKWSVIPGDYYASVQNLHIIENTGRPGELDRYYTADKQAMSIKIYVKDHKGDTIRKVVSKARQYIKEIEQEYHPEVKVGFRMAGGLIGVEGATNEVLRDSQLLAFLLAFGGVFLFCTITHRSIVAGIILLIPLAISNVITFAFMAWKLIGLTVSTFPVFSVGIGLGVDYGIYLLNRIQNEYKVGNDLDTAVTVATSTTGKAVIYIATTLTLGVIFWFFSDLMFQANMGLLLGFVMILNMLGALFVIPAVISLIKPKFITKLRSDA